ncbi:Phosphate binding protein, partial [Operophtera brumata]
MQNGHCYLQITEDHMQTAVNAFAIFQEGTIDDVLRLPPLYVLRSARTISMMKIAREKLVATWEVVKRGLQTVQITHKTLEMYRPLFKYINGREIAKLNLSDERILSYIGTHADLDRHQVGVVASKYIKLNEHWKDVKYLNLMNNLICGVPFLYMRTLSENTYLQLSHQVLGKSNSWCASDVARLGLLLTEVDVSELSDAGNGTAEADVSDRDPGEVHVPKNHEHTGEEAAEIPR